MKKLFVFIRQWSLLQNSVSFAEALAFRRRKPCETPFFRGCSFKTEVLKELQCGMLIFAVLSITACEGIFDEAPAGTREEFAERVELMMKTPVTTFAISDTYGYFLPIINGAIKTYSEIKRSVVFGTSAQNVEIKRYKGDDEVPGAASERYTSGQYYYEIYAKAPSGSYFQNGCAISYRSSNYLTFQPTRIETIEILDVDGKYDTIRFKIYFTARSY